jgi:hypothetical protein
VQLALRCRACGQSVVVHPGPLIDLPFGLDLVELLAATEDWHHAYGCEAAKVPVISETI